MSTLPGMSDIEAGMNGRSSGTDGAAWRAAWKAYAVMIPLIAVIDVQNVLSVVRDRAQAGHPIAAWEPATWEASSGIAYLIFAPIAFLAARWAPPKKGGWLRFALVHPPASAVFSSLHILGMFVIRIPVYALAGKHYGGPLFDFAAEYRKDIPAYVIMAGLIWLIRELEARRAEPLRQAATTIDIKDGSKVIRTQITDIVAVSSAGNYVEVVLADGRRPLTRATLTAMEATLRPHGFVRTHRSWLVNIARVREFAAVGSGDFTLQLEGGTKAPLSRRFRAALERLGLS